MDMKLVWLVVPLVFFVIIVVPNSFAEEIPWHTYIAVGDYGYSDPPKHNEFFIIKYRSINGTTNAFNVEDRTFTAKVNSEKNALFEIKIPRNYPYTNIYQVPEDFFGISSNGIILNSGYEVKKTECFFSYSIQFSGNQTIQLYFTQYPTGIPFHGDDIPQSCMVETIFLDPPLKQFKDGTFSNKITCKKDLELIIKYNGIPSCVKPTSLVRLTTNGWYYPATNNPSQYIGSGFDKNAQTAIQIALQNQQVQNLLEKQNTVIRSVHGTLTNESNCAVNYCTVINIDQLGTRETLVVIVDITNKTVDSIHTTPHWGTSQEGIDSSNCNLEPEPGFCKAAIEKYYFDAEYNLCKSFTWGGCGGVVPFDTLDDCHVMCK